MAYTASEQDLLDRISAELAPLDRYAKQPLSESFLRTTQGFSELGKREARDQSKQYIRDLSLVIDMDVRDPSGKHFPEVRLQYRPLSLSPVVRSLREALGLLPRAHVLVLTPAGYRVTLLRNLDSRRFNRNQRARLAPYNPSSVANLSSFLLEVFGPYFSESAEQA